jgi:hypothetical protein
MSRLQQYINEETTNDLQFLVNMIRSDCKPFLKEMKKAGQFLYRGYNDPNDITWSFNKDKIQYFKKVVRKDRKPRDMYQSVHEKLDKLFMEKFGWKVRSNSLFCTGDRTIALGYGALFIVFPIGKFRYVWSPEIYDMWTWLRRHMSSRKYKSSVPDFELAVSTYRDNDFAVAVKSNNEIAINCKKYYMISYYNMLSNSSDIDIKQFFDMLVK